MLNAEVKNVSLDIDSSTAIEDKLTKLIQHFKNEATLAKKI